MHERSERSRIKKREGSHDPSLIGRARLEVDLAALNAALDETNVLDEAERKHEQDVERFTGHIARLDEEGEEDDAVLSLLATFDVPELGHAYDMMRIEELYQLIARRGDADDCLVYDILDEAESEVIRPRVAAALDEFQDDGGDDDDGAS